MKSLIRKLIASLGYEVRRCDARASLEGVLRNARRNRIAPGTVFDVGAAHGRFARACHAVFPEARYVLIEPLEEYRAAIETVRRGLPDSLHVAAAAAAVTGEVTFNVHPDLVGSSLYREEEDSDINGVPRTVPAITLDGVAGEHALVPPYLIKADVQGAERDVLEGAGKVLERTEMVILEISFFEFFKGAPLIVDMISTMKSLGFVAYDIFGLSHRPLDGALAQADVVFVTEDGPLRSHHHYATRAQRSELTRKLTF